MWEAVDKLSSELPSVISLLHGHTSLSKMSWSDINSLVKSVIGEVDDICQDLGEMKGEFAVSYTHLTLPTNREV